MKKAVIWEDLADLLLGGLIIFIAISGYLVITTYQGKQVEATFQEKVSNLNNDAVLSNYLDAEIDGFNLADAIREAYINKEDTPLEEGLDSFLEGMYSTKVCWELLKENKKWLSKNKCNGEQKLLDSSAILPLPDKTTLKISLKINGYADK